MADLEDVAGPDEGKGHAGLEPLVLRLEVVVLVALAVGKLVDLDVVLLQLVVDPRLEPLELGLGEAVGLGYHRHEVDLGTVPLTGLPGLAFSRPKKQIWPFLKLVGLDIFDNLFGS